MIKKSFLVISLAILGISLSAQVVSAQTQGNADTSPDLGIENPGLLPTSPFYFLKEWKRAIQKVFTFNPVKKAELELEDANQRAAEIKKLENVAPQNVEAITKAINNYKENIDALKARLEGLKETSENPNVNKLLDKLTDRSLKHIELFEDLKEKFESSGLKQEINAVQDKLDDVIKDVPQRFENPEAFKERLQKVIKESQNDVLTNLRSIETLDRIIEKLPVEAKEKITEVKSNLIQKIGEQVNKLKSVDKEKIFNVETLKQLPGDESRRMNILDEVKNKLKDSKVINKIQEFKDEVLQKEADEENELKQDEEGVVCTEQYEPVCGSNNKTYPNSCYAEREGIKEYKKGECATTVGTDQSQTYTVSVTDEGFSPKELKIKKGDKVTWVNKTDRPVWPASAVHPTHDVYPEKGGCIASAFDACRGLKNGEEWSFTFNFVGEWKYHDHLNPSWTGVVQVEE